MCDPYYTLSNVSTKLDDLNKWLRDGEDYKLRDMRYYKTLGQFILHEMFHLQSTSDPEPRIFDQIVTDQDAETGGRGDKFNPKAYGPDRVHRLAQRVPNPKMSKRGGAEKSSVNADSYAILLANIYWWDVNGVFPGAPGADGKTNLLSVLDPETHNLYMPSRSFDNATGMPSQDQMSALYDGQVQGFVNTEMNPETDDDDDDTGTSTADPSAATTNVPPASTPTPPPPPPSDVCGDWYKLLYDHFEIYGKDFDADKFGTDGGGLRDNLEHCGAITEWSFTWLNNDANGMQWFASGNQPIGTKSCVGSAIVSAGGSGPDGCTGTG